MTRRYGSDLIVDLIKQYNIPHISLNPGSTYRGLHDSLVNYGGNKPPMILCPHEEIAVQIAHGYAKTTGKPMAAIVHDTVGLLHCTMAVYYAYLDRVPLMLLGAAGPMDPARRRPHIDWIHTSVHQAQPIRDYIKWDRQPVTAQEVVESFARAHRVATQDPQGPVYLCYDAGFQEDLLTTEVPLPDPARFAHGTPAYPDPHALDALAAQLVAAETPVIIAGYAARNHGAFYDLIKLAEATGAAVIDLNNRLNFPTNHPLNISYAQKEILRRADLILAVDVKDLFGPLVETDRVARKTKFITPPHCKFAEIGFRDVNISKWSDEFQQLMAMDWQILADSSVALPLLTARVEEKVGARRAPIEARKREITKVHENARKKWRDEAREDWDAKPITTGRLALEIWDMIKNEDWVLTANTLEEWALKLWDFDAPTRHPGKSLGTSTQIGIALGVALAHKGSGKVVVDIQPDGDLMFDPGALWVAANQKLPMLVVMHNNRAYYNDWEHQIRIAEQRGTPVENAWVGQAINDPAPDFAALARSFGWHAEGPIEEPREIAPALSRALRVVKGGQPALVDTVTRFR
ncbi:MAG: thiamine pyrophosphate-binding protein [Chloroflexi bacterium]|nr:thiamine pyrophosphate-binding protein [Chloroflexota bacterium]